MKYYVITHNSLESIWIGKDETNADAICVVCKKAKKKLIVYKNYIAWIENSEIEERMNNIVCLSCQKKEYNKRFGGDCVVVKSIKEIEDYLFLRKV